MVLVNEDVNKHSLNAIKVAIGKANNNAHAKLKPDIVIYVNHR